MISVSSAVSLTSLNPPDCSEEGDIRNRISDTVSLCVSDKIRLYSI